MRKLMGVFTGVVCCILSVMSVRADVIWEPDDSFYRKHAEECSYVNRLYTANGPDGVVIVYRSPESPEVVDEWENGYQVSICFTYEGGDGIVWGIYDDYRGKCGWMPMDYMEVVYDSISFSEEYADEIVTQSGELDGKYGGKDIFFWEYPGAESGYTVTVGEDTPQYRSMYTDGNGNRWGKVGYYYGLKNVWVCMDHPEADYGELYPEGVSVQGGKEDSSSLGNEEEQTEPGGERNVPEEQSKPGEAQRTKRIVPKRRLHLVAGAVLMVVLTTAVTAVLLVILKRRK